MWYQMYGVRSSSSSNVCFNVVTGMIFLWFSSWQLGVLEIENKVFQDRRGMFSAGIGHADRGRPPKSRFTIAIYIGCSIGSSTQTGNPTFTDRLPL